MGKKKPPVDMSPLQSGYISTLTKNPESTVKRIIIGVPLTGVVRAEWMLARYGQAIPCNWSAVDIIQWIDAFSPLQYTVADARNTIATHMVREGFEWLLFIDHDTVLPPVFLLRINEYMLKKEVPLVGGLYFTRSVPSEPLIYRGRGNSYFQDWKMGDRVWVDGMGLGCHLIHRSILQVLYDESEEYQLPWGKVRRIFRTPSEAWFDPETGGWETSGGTEDLEFYSRIINDDILRKAGWKAIARRKFPFLCDTGLYCKHIDLDGVQYPACGEDVAFMTLGQKQALGGR